MSDYFVRRLAEERTKDYLREVERDERAALLSAAPADTEMRRVAAVASQRPPDSGRAPIVVRLARRIAPRIHRPAIAHRS
jgi:hypothetical protein